MENPVAEIPNVIRGLCLSSPTTQKQTVEKYFTPSASFTHPFCRTGTFSSSRWLILQIYRWYKILSPVIELHIHSVAFDANALLLYVRLTQTFRIWFIPSFLYPRIPVNLTTVLTLEKHDLGFTIDKAEADGSATQETRYFISQQEDFYQSSDCLAFLLPWVGKLLVIAWGFIATGFCVLGAVTLAPVTEWRDHKLNP